MRIVIAPDKFKGSLDAAAVAQCLRAGLYQADRSLVIETLPMADGGEGTVDAAVSGGFVRHTTTVTGPTGHLVAADFAVRGSDAVIEIAAASGLAVLPGGIRDALGATSAGTGELIRAALDRGCRTIVLAVGGSACTDGGAGMLTGLGAMLLDEAGTPLAAGGAALANLATADLTRLDVRLASCTIILASDVDNPLLGPHGAAAIFGPQKGATDDNVVELDAALARFALVLSDVVGDTAHAAISAPGAGSAGGIGYGAMAVLGATRRAGIDVVAELTHLAERIAGADLVITGEGSLDQQSLLGKTPVGVAQVAARAGVSVIAVCGRTSLSENELRSAGFSHTFALTDLESDIDVCMNETERLLTQVGTMIQAAHLTNTSSTKREES